MDFVQFLGIFCEKLWPARVPCTHNPYALFLIAMGLKSNKKTNHSTKNVSQMLSSPSSPSPRRLTDSLFREAQRPRTSTTCHPSHWLHSVNKQKPGVPSFLVSDLCLPRERLNIYGGMCPTLGFIFHLKRIRRISWKCSRAPERCMNTNLNWHPCAVQVYLLAPDNLCASSAIERRIKDIIKKYVTP